MAESKGKHVKGAEKASEQRSDSEEALESLDGVKAKKSKFSLFNRKAKASESVSEDISAPVASDKEAPAAVETDAADASSALSTQDTGPMRPVAQAQTQSQSQAQAKPPVDQPPAVPEHTATMPAQPSSYGYERRRKIPSRDYTQPIGPGAQNRVVPAIASRGFSMGEATASGRKKRSPLAIFGIAVASLLLACVCVYLLGVAVFSFLFFPNTKVIDADISLKPVSAVSTILKNRLDDYAFLVTGDGIRLDLSSVDAGLDLDSDSIAQNMHSHINPWLWPYEFFRDHDETDSLIVSVGSTQLAETLTEAAEKVNANAQQPKNATIAFDSTLGSYVVVPEEPGTAIDIDAFISYVSTQVVQLTSVITLDDSVLLQPTITSGDAKVLDAKKEANQMVSTNIALTVADSPVAVLDAPVVSQWITVSDDLKVSLDSTALANWTVGVASEANTVGAERQYTTPYGKNVTVSGGDYGWTVSSDSLVSLVSGAVKEGRQGDVPMPTSTDAATWLAAGHPDFGNRYIDVDLSQQHARMYDDSGALIWESGIVTGNPNTDSSTPSGVYYIKSNAGESELIGLNADGSEDYRTLVNYWMPFRGNSIGFHDANWQPSSAFSDPEWYKSHGSHGCVNLPPAKAQELSSLIRVGDPVVVHY